jgi:hypothetical protein
MTTQPLHPLKSCRAWRNRKAGRMRDVNLGYRKKLALLVGVFVGFLLLALLGFLVGLGRIRRLVLGEQADRSHQERQAKHQSHEFLHLLRSP